MLNPILKFILRTLIFTAIASLAAVIIWYVTGSATLQRLSSILFWAGCALIVVSVLMYAGGNKNTSGGKRMGGSTIGMDFGKQLDAEDAFNRPVADKIETILLQIAAVGGLLLVVSWLIVKWFL